MSRRRGDKRRATPNPAKHRGGASAAAAPPTEPAPEEPSWFSQSRVGEFFRRIHPLEVFVISRVLVFVTSYVGLMTRPGFSAPGAKLLHRGEDPWRAFPESIALDGLVRWDAAWYYSIYRDGYRFIEGGQSNVAFFPFYPLVAGVLAEPLDLLLPTHQAFYLAAILVSHVAFLAALIGLSRLATLLVGAEPARRAVWLLALYPFSLFYSAAYTESLFLALAVWSFYQARRDRWLVACLLAALAGATRSFGIFLGPILALEYLRQRGYRLRNLDAKAAALLLVPLGLAAFAGYLWIRVGDPLAFVATQGTWGHSFDLPPVGTLVTYVFDGTREPYRRFLALSYVGVIFSLPVMVIVAWRRLGAALGLLAALSTLLPLSTGLFAGIGRYSSTVFPVFLVAGILLSRRKSFAATCVVFAAMLVLFTFGFSHWQRPL